MVNFLSKAMVNWDARLGSTQTGVSELFSGCYRGGCLRGNMKLLGTRRRLIWAPRGRSRRLGRDDLKGPRQHTVVKKVSSGGRLPESNPGLVTY